MDWLKRLPVVGPSLTRLTATHAWRSYERMDRVKWTRLAAAMTFTSFVALFPLLTVAAAIAAATLSQAQQDQLENKIADQVPGISDQLDIDGLVQNAGTIGLIAGAVLLFTGIGWVGSMRECLRAVWELPDDEENPFLRKAKDAGVLVGFGGAVLVTLATSTVASAMVGWITDRLGIDEGGWGGVLLHIAAFGVAVLADFLLLLYVLTLLPGVEPPRRRLVAAALTGAVGFELLKLLLSGYMQGVATKSMYGAFGVPVALLLWINFTAKLVVFCAAWTATGSKADELPEEYGPSAASRTAEKISRPTSTKPAPTEEAGRPEQARPPEEPAPSVRGRLSGESDASVKGRSSEAADSFVKGRLPEEPAPSEKGRMSQDSGPFRKAGRSSDPVPSEKPGPFPDSTLSEKPSPSLDSTLSEKPGPSRNPGSSILAGPSAPSEIRNGSDGAPGRAAASGG